MDKRNSVLIVDDEISNIMLLTDILSPEYRVYAAANGENAIAAAQSHAPDVILLDVIMPEIDGYEVISALKGSTMTHDIPVIFVTSLSDAKDEEKGLALGAADYIAKPFSPAIVKLRVGNQIKTLTHTEGSRTGKEPAGKASKAGQELAAAMFKAQEAERAKNELLLNMNHEMLTPMNTIMGMTQVLRLNTQNFSDSEKECLEEIENASRHLLELISNLLDISNNNKECALTGLANGKFDFRAMIGEIFRKTSRNAVDKDLHMDSDIAPTIPPKLVGDKRRLTQVITNLLKNAIKFTPAGGSVRLSASVLSDDYEKVTLQIEVSDTGIGIPKDRQDEIFRVFELADKKTTARYGGAGLGLPISKGIVEMMGGIIWVDSEVGKGSTFGFTCTLGK